MTTNIKQLSSLPTSHVIHEGLEQVFFASSATTTFPNPQARTALYDLWLGQYLTHDEHETFVALDETGQVAGYIVGSLTDPAGDPRYASLGYFAHFAHLTRAYPAHLHMNVATHHRSRGLGASLMSTFLAHLRNMSSPGVHVVTGKGMRNVRFYLANGFQELAEAPWNGRTVVMLGRRLP
jgi:GNAT superfamily N-acetyltransferase